MTTIISRYQQSREGLDRAVRDIRIGDSIATISAREEAKRILNNPRNGLSPSEEASYDNSIRFAEKYRGGTC